MLDRKKMASIHCGQFDSQEN